jgi:hypothetical protein
MKFVERGGRSRVGTIELLQMSTGAVSSGAGTRVNPPFLPPWYIAYEK